VTEPQQRVLRADLPLTLAGVPTGFLPWLAADLSHAAHGTGKGARAVAIVADEAAMRALAETLPSFAPEVEVLTFPGWDCLPYDRASPALRVMAERLATLSALQTTSDKPQLLVATASAATQRLLTPFRIRQLTRRIAKGERVEREALISQLNALGYQRADTVAEHGEYAVRGSLIDVFPAGEELALRLDFFGDEIDSIRRFDPADQRSTDKADAFVLMPASEALLDIDTIKRFRSRYRETFGATATQDPLYQALSERRRMAGMEHWLPLLEERLETLFDHLGEDDLIIRDSAADQALESRREAIEDYYQNRVRAMEGQPGSYRPLESGVLYLAKAEWESVEAERPIHLASPFPEPESERVIDFGVQPARDFAPERAQQANVYEALAKHIAALRRRRSARRPSLRCSSCPSTTASPRPTSRSSPSRTF
jgi:transcription-repair coupling factor (superfamily II helicase)